MVAPNYNRQVIRNVQKTQPRLDERAAMKNNIRFVLICIVAWICWKSVFVFAQERRITVVDAVANIARAHNANSVTDEMTVTSIATAVGRKVVIRNVSRVKKGLLPAQLAEFQSGIRAEMAPKVCAANREVFSWKKGISYAFI